MKVKELISKYPNYQVIEMGYPNSIPFTQLPRELDGLYGKDFERVVMELDVKGFEAIDKPFESIDITHLVFGGKKRSNSHYKGTLYIYLKGDK